MGLLGGIPLVRLVQRQLGWRSRCSGAWVVFVCANALLWGTVALLFLPSVFQALLAGGLVSCLLALSVVDWHTYEIPVVYPLAIGVLGALRLGTNPSSWCSACIGSVCISLPLLVLLLVSHGRAIGGGDIKLLAACGFFLGWKQICFGFFAGCLFAAVIHLARMRLVHASRVLAFGPYLSLGMYSALLCMEPLLQWYGSLWWG